MNKAIFIYNPLSGNRSIAKRLDYIMGRFMDCGILLQPYRIQEDAEKKLPEVLEKGDYSLAVVSGGDGTISSVLNTILKCGVKLPIGVIPAGTCNDFARSLEIPKDLNKCLDIILGGNTIDVDVGLINDEKYFLNTCGGGSFVDVSFSTSNEMKKNLGPLSYYLKALTEVSNIKPFKARVTTESEVVEEDLLLFLIINGRHAAGFSNLVKDADFSDGLMDIILIKHCLHIDMAGMLLKVLRDDLQKAKHVITLKAKECTIESLGNVAITIDGEKGNGLPIKVEFLQKALTVFIK